MAMETVVKKMPLNGNPEHKIRSYYGGRCVYFIIRYRTYSIIYPSIFIVHYNDVIMGAMASQIKSLAIVYSTVYSGADQRKHQSPASLAFVWGIHR